MSELKSESIHNMYWDSMCGVDTNRKVYLKSDVDKVIMEKDKEIAELKERVQEERSAKVNYKISANDLSDGLKDAYEEIKHHKYKRCLNKAEWCEERSARYDLLQQHSGFGWGREIEFYYRWYMRWLELAEKFKEA